jgi:hypothetical protein
MRAVAKEDLARNACRFARRPGLLLDSPRGGEEVADPLLALRDGHDANGALGLDAATKPALPAHDIAWEALRASDADVAAAGAGDLEQHNDSATPDVQRIKLRA